MGFTHVGQALACLGECLKHHFLAYILHSITVHIVWVKGKLRPTICGVIDMALAGLHVDGQSPGSDS
ncbi:MAG: hypothetical protein GC164_10230 [Phycisphaera sp.]|nr:hypothetical protein [Phycisphaera sp.]